MATPSRVALTFERTSRFCVIGISSNAPPSPPAAASFAGTNSAGAGLASKIAAVGEEIRCLKAAKASKDEVMAKVGVLNGLKAQYLANTGAPYGADPASNKAPGKAAGASKAMTKGGGGQGPGAGKAGAGSPVAPLDGASAARVAAKFASLRSIGEECVTEADLRALLERGERAAAAGAAGAGASGGGGFRLYDGFEPSGRMHIAQGIFKAINVNKCTAAGGTFVFWVADWFALMNDKMGGDLEKIKDVGKYFVEVWTAAGMDMSKVEMRWASADLTGSESAPRYWPLMLDIARRFTLARITKCCTIMGRAEGNLTAAQILYPIMQCTDVFFLKADVCQLGVDQRKVNMLAREYCDSGAGLKHHKPVILSHHMLYGLKQGQAKMSKSDPDSAIFMEDSRADIARKLSQAHCPVVAAQGGGGAVADGELRLVVDELENPCLDYVEHIVLAGRPGATFTAGGVRYSDVASVKAALVKGALSEADLKAALVDAVDALVAPVRDHFSRGEPKALLERIAGYKREDAAAAAQAAAAKPLRRLDLSGGSAAPKVHAVFAPLPGAYLPLGTALTLLARIRAAPPKSRVVLWLPDWSALVLSCLGGDPKAIRAAYTLLVAALHALDALHANGAGGDGGPGGPGVGSLGGVEVVYQSEAALSNPSDYWISVIDVGRALKVHQVREGYLPLPRPAHNANQAPPAAPAGAGAAAEEGRGGGGSGSGSGGGSGGSGAAPAGVSEPAGMVVASLMHVADMLALAPTTVSCDAFDAAPHELALAYWSSANVAGRNGLPPPRLLICASSVSTHLARDPLPASAEGARFAEAGDTDDELFVGDDPKGGANKKMKRAFCEPTNTARNPPLSIANDLLVAHFGEFRAGGRAYTGRSAWIDLCNAFAKDTLTPQLLKPAVAAGVATVLDALNAAVKADKKGALAQADKVLKQFVKKAAAGGKKKK